MTFNSRINKFNPLTEKQYQPKYDPIMNYISNGNRKQLNGDQKRYLELQKQLLHLMMKILVKNTPTKDDEDIRKKTPTKDDEESIAFKNEKPEIETHKDDFKDI